MISPHLDDAALACGRFLVRLSRHCRVVVATVFAGKPRGAVPFTEWDRASGFAPGDDVVAARREEDRQALRHLGAAHRWLAFADSQYGQTPTVRCVARALRRVFLRERPALVLFPLGLFHSDHHLVRDAALSMRRTAGAAPGRWVAFEDGLYRTIPGLLAQGISRLRRNGLRLRPFRFAGSLWTHARKQAAVACYVSQLRALATPGRLGCADAVAVEGYWSIAGAAHKQRR